MTRQHEWPSSRASQKETGDSPALDEARTYHARYYLRISSRLMMSRYRCGATRLR